MKNIKIIGALLLSIIWLTGCLDWEEGKTLLRLRYPGIQLIEEAEHGDSNVKLNLEGEGFLKYFGARYNGETAQCEFVTVLVDKAGEPTIALVHEPVVVFSLPGAICDFDFGYD